MSDIVAEMFQYMAFFVGFVLSVAVFVPLAYMIGSVFYASAKTVVIRFKRWLHATYDIDMRDLDE